MTKLRLGLVLSEVFRAPKRYAEAEALGAKTLAVLAENGPMGLYIVSMMTLGQTHLAQGHVEDCRSLFERAANEALICLDKKTSTR